MRPARPSGRFAPGIEIRAHYTLVAEGAGGSITRALENHYGLRRDVGESHFALGIKEVWRTRKNTIRPEW